MNGKNVLISIYNPSILNNMTALKLKVPNVTFEVIDSQNNNILADIFCLNSTDNNDCDLYFFANLTAF